MARQKKRHASSPSSSLLARCVTALPDDISSYLTTRHQLCLSGGFLHRPTCTLATIPRAARDAPSNRSLLELFEDGMDLLCPCVANAIPGRVASTLNSCFAALALVDVERVGASVLMARSLPGMNVVVDLTLARIEDHDPEFVERVLSLSGAVKEQAEAHARAHGVELLTLMAAARRTNRFVPQDWLLELCPGLTPLRRPSGENFERFSKLYHKMLEAGTSEFNSSSDLLVMHHGEDTFWCDPLPDHAVPVHWLTRTCYAVTKDVLVVPEHLVTSFVNVGIDDEHTGSRISQGTGQPGIVRLREPVSVPVAETWGTLVRDGTSPLGALQIARDLMR